MAAADVIGDIQQQPGTVPEVRKENRKWNVRHSKEERKTKKE